MPLSYFPPGAETTRVSWYGGESTQLHYEVRRDNEWSGVEVRTLMDMPTGVKELSQELVDFYNYCS
jgi:hypothetical protein|tara:strand:- start:97 stop:294 length:198 start_codon:yes stop_codon:yes gene_type:complete